MDLFDPTNKRMQGLQESSILVKTIHLLIYQQIPAR